MSDSLLRQAEQQARSAICLTQYALQSPELNSGFKRHALVNAVLLQTASALRLLVGHAVVELSKSSEPVTSFVITTKQWQDFGALGLRHYLGSYTKVPETALMSLLQGCILIEGDSVNNLLYLLESLGKGVDAWQTAAVQPDNLIASNAVTEAKPEHWTRVELAELAQFLEDLLVFIQERRAQEEEF